MIKESLFSTDCSVWLRISAEMANTVVTYCIRNQGQLSKNLSIDTTAKNTFSPNTSISFFLNSQRDQYSFFIATEDSIATINLFTIEHQIPQSKI